MSDSDDFVGQDDQTIAEETDDDSLDLDDMDYPPDHAFASREAAEVLGSGEVPRDSVEERLWREEPDVLPVEDDSVQLVEAEPDGGADPDFTAESIGESMHEIPSDGELLADEADAAEEAREAERDADATAVPGTVSAEEAAVHIIEP